MYCLVRFVHENVNNSPVYLQRPNVDQSIRVLEGGFGQRYLHFQYVYQNMVRSFHYKKIYGICDHRNESNY